MSAHKLLVLDDRIPLHWGADGELVFGFDRPVLRLSGLDTKQKIFLKLLETGFAKQSLNTVATSCGIATPDLNSLMQQLKNVLVERETPELRHWRERLAVTVVGAERPETFVAKGLREHFAVMQGSAISTALVPVVVSLDRYLPKVLMHHKLLHEGIAVLPVRFSDRSVWVGPVASNPNDYEELLADWRLRYPADCKTAVAQICHLPAATEVPRVLHSLNGLIYEQLKHFALQKTKPQIFEIQNDEHHFCVSSRAFKDGQNPKQQLLAS